MINSPFGSSSPPPPTGKSKASNPPPPPPAPLPPVPKISAYSSLVDPPCSGGTSTSISSAPNLPSPTSSVTEGTLSSGPVLFTTGFVVSSAVNGLVGSACTFSIG